MKRLKLLLWIVGELQGKPECAHGNPVAGIPMRQGRT